MNAAQLINQTSGEFEYYTPPAIIEAARSTMGYIDLDPASSAKANLTVGADRILTVEQDGLEYEWWGRVWLNHPFGRESNPLWISKLIVEFGMHHITQACCITFACTSEAWFAPLMDFPQCYLRPRTNYYLPDGSQKVGVTKGSVVTYLGSNVRAFTKNFAELGSIMIPAYVLETPRPLANRTPEQLEHADRLVWTGIQNARKAEAKVKAIVRGRR